MRAYLIALRGGDLCVLDHMRVPWLVLLRGLVGRVWLPPRGAGHHTRQDAVGSVAHLTQTGVLVLDTQRIEQSRELEVELPG